MEEIRFRQKLKKEFCKNGEEFHYWGYIDEGFVSPMGSSYVCGESEQYVGFEMKGREVYEGDIYDVAFSGHCVVRIDSYLGAVFGDDDVIYSTWIDEMSQDCIGDYLGDIHENPELRRDNND